MGSMQTPGMTRLMLVAEAVKGFEIGDRETGKPTGDTIRTLEWADVPGGVWLCQARFGPGGTQVGASFIALRLISSDLFVKDMDESSGPTLDDCPARVFDHADPLPTPSTGYATDFRLRVARRLGR